MTSSSLPDLTRLRDEADVYLFVCDDPPAGEGLAIHADVRLMRD
jgi:hypothetical protein